MHPQLHAPLLSYTMMLMLDDRKPNQTIVETFYILDLDRCLVNTDRLQALLQRIIERETPIGTGTLNEVREAYEAAGGSFDTASYMKDFFDSQSEDGQELWNRIARLAIEESQGEDMLLPYAAELLARLRSENVAFGIVTYGGNMWQETKIAASGLGEIPHIVTPIKEKGRLLTSWKQDDGSFILPGPLGGGRVINAKTLVFIDDKPISFMGIPDGVKAICAITPGVTWPSSVLDALPPQVEIIQGLHDTIKLLFGH